LRVRTPNGAVSLSLASFGGKGWGEEAPGLQSIRRFMERAGKEKPFLPAAERGAAGAILGGGEIEGNAGQPPKAGPSLPPWGVTFERGSSELARDLPGPNGSAQRTASMNRILTFGR